MLTYPQALILGLLQGISELFPISSLGHSVIIPSLLGWHINQSDSFFLDFLVATHTATALVLIAFYWHDWVKIVKNLIKAITSRDASTGGVPTKVGWLLVVGTIPAGIIGILLQEPLRVFFASPRFAAFFLILNGFVLLYAEKKRQKSPAGTTRKNTSPLPSNVGIEDEHIAALSYPQALKVGAAQALALIPGFSRSGATMAGSLLVGLDNSSAARFSFLLATPIILGASAIKLPELFSAAYRPQLGVAVAGALMSAVSAYFAVRFLVRYFHSNRLTGFAYYSFIAGGTALLILVLLPR